MSAGTYSKCSSLDEWKQAPSKPASANIHTASTMDVASTLCTVVSSSSITISPARTLAQYSKESKGLACAAALICSVLLSDSSVANASSRACMATSPFSPSGVTTVVHMCASTLRSDTVGLVVADDFAYCGLVDIFFFLFAFLSWRGRTGPTLIPIKSSR